MTPTTTEQVLAFIAAYRQRHHNSPSLREIARGCHLATSTVSYHLRLLQTEGRIRRGRGRARDIQIVASSPEGLRQLPLPEDGLAEMAADRDIQAESRVIAAEFADTEGDGLTDE